MKQFPIPRVLWNISNPNDNELLDIFGEPKVFTVWDWKWNPKNLPGEAEYAILGKDMADLMHFQCKNLIPG